VVAVRVREFPFIAVMHGRAALPKPEFSKGANLGKIDLFESFSFGLPQKKKPGNHRRALPKRTPLRTYLAENLNTVTV
jgi:hypothetical protein